MRIALITLAVAALGFIGSIVWILYTRANGGVVTPRTTTSEIKISNESAVIEMLRSQIKTEEKLKDLEAKLDTLSKDGGSLTPTVASTDSATGSTGSGTAGSTASGSSVMTNSGITPISAKFLSKVIQKVNPVLEKNNGIFGLYIFDSNATYSTYTDSKYPITIVASRTPFETFKKNFNSIDKNIFTINAVPLTTFGFPAFYVNATKPDTSVRIVMQVETQTLLVTIPKTKFTEFKSLLLKK